jgi:hypothetical protein
LRFPLHAQARFGSTVGAYFQFFQWLVLVFMAACLLSVVFLVQHVLRGSFSWTGVVAGYLPEVIVPSSYTTK